MPGRVEKKTLKRNNAFSLSDVWPHPSTRTPVAAIMKPSLISPSDIYWGKYQNFKNQRRLRYRS